MSLHKRDRNRIIDSYTNRLREFGDDVRTLASGSLAKEKTRFQVLTEVGDLRHKTVLDLGCGLGYLYPYLRDAGIPVNYIGVDLNPHFIEICARKYPECRFFVGDIFSYRPKRKVDYVLCSQVFNLKLSPTDNFDLVKRSLKRCLALCSEGVAIDFLTRYVDFMEPHLYYYSPEKMLTFCKTIARRVTLRHDYPLFEFTMYLYKRGFRSWRKS